MRKEIHPIVHRAVAADGFSTLELIIVLTVVSIVVSFSVISIRKSRQSINLQNSARLFASYAEKARIDAIRRHDPTNIDIKGPGTYSITMNFDGTGVTTRTFTLDSGVSFTDSANVAYTVDGGGNVSSSTGEAVSFADFNWRGRTSQCSMLFRLKTVDSERSVVQVAGSGDITIDSVISTPANVTVTNVNSNDVSSSAVLSGTNSQPEFNPCGVNGGGGVTIPPPVGTCLGNRIFPDVGSVTVRKNGQSTATVNITVTSAGTINSLPDSNLSVSPTSQSVTSNNGGTFAFTIRSITRVRSSSPPFTVTFTNPCNSVPVYVNVTN